MGIYFWGLIISLLVYIVVGNYAGRKVRNLDDYYVAGRRAPTLLIVGTLVASFLSTNAFLAETGFAYDGYAFLMLLLVGVNTSGYVLGAVFFGRFVRRSKTRTIPEFFARRFDSVAMQRLAGVTTVIGMLAYLLAVTQGGSILIADVAGIPYGTALFITWLGYMLFTMYSGSRGVIITDTIMFLLFTLVTFIGMPYLLSDGGSWLATLERLANYELKPDILSAHGLTGPNASWSTPVDAMTWALILGASWAFVLAVSPWQTSRYLMAKNEHVVLRAACISGMVLALLYIVLLFSAAAINLSDPNISPSERVMVWASMNLMPPLVGTLVITGIMASALSSCSTFLSLIGFSISNDIWQMRHVDERLRLSVSRWVMFAAATIALLLAYFQPPAVMWITYFAGTLFASSWGPVAIASIWSKRVTAPAALLGMAVGFLVNIITKFLDQFGFINLPVIFDPFILGFIANSVCIFILSSFTRPTKKSVEYLSQLHKTPEEEFAIGEVRRTLWWTRLIMIIGVLTSIFLLFYYAIPYAEAKNQAFSLVSSSTLLAIGYGASVFLVGLLAYWQVRRHYLRG